MLHYLVATPVPCSQQFLAASPTASRSRATLWRRSTRRDTRSSVRASTWSAPPTSTASAAAEVRCDSNTSYIFSYTRLVPAKLARSFVPGHPVTGMHYVCTHKLELYSHAGYSKKAYNDLKGRSADLAASGEPHVKVWLPEAHDENFYLMEEAGIFYTSNTLQTYTRSCLRSTFAWLLLAHSDASLFVMSAQRFGQIGFSAIHCDFVRRFWSFASIFSRAHWAKRLRRLQAFLISASSL